MNDDVLEAIAERNAFYRKKYRIALGVYLLSWIVIAALISMLFFLHRHPPHPLYFVADDVSRLIQDIPVDQPNMSLQEVMDWTVEAVEKAYSYDFVNYRAELQSAQKYFTNYGWRQYMQGLTASNNLLALKQNKYVVIAHVVDKPKVLISGILDGSYAWKFEMPLLVTYLKPPYDDSAKFSNPLVITVIVQRQNLLQSYKGLGVLQMIGNLVFTPEQQTINPAVGQ